MMDRPYFMENKEWYEFDFDKRKFVLTNKAPEKAKESYEEFYKELNNANIDGFLIGSTSLNIENFIEIIKGVDNE